MDPESPKRRRLQRHQGKTPFNMGFLRVCHQIHDEAKLLPYKLNTFSFRSLSHICTYTTARQPAQLRLIRSIELATYWYRHMISALYWPETVCFSPMDFELLQRFEGLEHINILQANNACFRDQPNELENMVQFLRPWKPDVAITTVNKTKE
jgi:hypothetical protein